MVSRLPAGASRIRTLRPRYMADAFETILVAWLAFAFLLETNSFTGRDRRFESAFLQRGVSCEPKIRSAQSRRVCVLGLLG